MDKNELSHTAPSYFHQEIGLLMESFTKIVQKIFFCFQAAVTIRGSPDDFSDK
ncbi:MULTISPECIES: hypothetical protein [unclassified Anaerobiospirillum]|uniref:hypothetical protein n=1 Tax=unclassified Anaerobiospirillum TaxID=2647410 RepID=UPI001FF4C7C4|nr:MULTISPECIES: hypothetical protein [unclassified Anaerobiospirillum]MCK0526136.1 hypothetical protein [Anaerobiospirillum sp. NML120449]MCK0533789.1 hypothetical protein [Anaerobiospirillum sp. NML120511]MCK0539020.1 hypothetical protein [Anaerobiospirillum sp. NML02-A-032]